MYGAERGALTGTPFVHLLDGDEAERERMHRTIRDQLMAQQYWEGDIESRRVDGTVFSASSRFNLHSGGEHKLFSLIQVDVTEQKRLEAEARHFQEKMIETAKLESVGLLAGGIAHDFNNLLTGILGNASLVFDQLSPSSSLRNPLKDVIRAGERAADLTRQLLAYSGKGRYVMRSIDVNALLAEIQNLVRMSTPTHVEVRLDTGGAATVHGDSAQLQQLLMNLIINGAEAVPPDRKGLVLVTTRLETVVSARGDLRPGAHVAIEVRDNGSGMDEATLARIFDPFFTTKFTGRGLGLAAALGIVRGHLGAIDVQSEPGVGSTFRVTLPLIAPVAETEDASPADGTADLEGSATILVIDDEEPVRNAARNTLQFHGYRVIQADSGAKGLEELRNADASISLVILDVTMPLMTGEETLRAIREVQPDVPVVISSGFNEQETMKKFSRSIVSGFLPKPYTAGQLAGKVKEVLTTKKG